MSLLSRTNSFATILKAGVKGMKKGIRHRYSQTNKQHRALAYNSIERDSLNDTNPEQQAKADEHMSQFLKGTLPQDVFNHYVDREIEYRSLHKK